MILSDVGLRNEDHWRIVHGMSKVCNAGWLIFHGDCSFEPQLAEPVTRSTIPSVAWSLTFILLRGKKTFSSSFWGIYILSVYNQGQQKKIMKHSLQPFVPYWNRIGILRPVKLSWGLAQHTHFLTGWAQQAWRKLYIKMQSVDYILITPCIHIKMYSWWLALKMQLNFEMITFWIQPAPQFAAVLSCSAIVPLISVLHTPNLKIWVKASESYSMQPVSRKGYPWKSFCCCNLVSCCSSRPSGTWSTSSHFGSGTERQPSKCATVDSSFDVISTPVHIYWLGVCAGDLLPTLAARLIKWSYAEIELFYTFSGDCFHQVGKWTLCVLQTCSQVP